MGLMDIGKAITSIGSVIPGPWQPFAVAGGAALSAIDANQKRQQAKGQQGQATQTAVSNYDQRGRYRNLGDVLTTQPRDYDFSSTYRAEANPLLTQAQGASGKQLAALSDGPDYLSQAKAALADFGASEDATLDDTYRTLGQKNAAMGRVGSEMATEDNSKALGDSLLRRKSLEGELIRDALNKSQDNKYRTLSAASQLAGQQFDMGQTGIGNRADQLRAERGASSDDFGRGMDLSRFGYGNTPEQAFERSATFANDQAAGSEADAAALGEVLGRLTKREKKPSGVTMNSLGFGDLG